MNSFPLPTSLALADVQRCPKAASPPKVMPNPNRRSSRSRYCLTYAEWISRALLSSKDQCLSLADIYEWMAFNVPGLHEQRFLHSSKGWKNAVRHTLSINPRFRKLKRFGKPSLWTLAEEYLRQTDGLSNLTAGSQSPGFVDPHNPDKKDGPKHLELGHSSVSSSGVHPERYGPISLSSDWPEPYSHTMAASSMQLPTVSSPSQLQNPYQSLPVPMGSMSQFQANGLIRRQQDYQRFLASLGTSGPEDLATMPSFPHAQANQLPAAPKSPTQILQVATLNGSEANFMLPRPLPMRCLTDQNLLLASLLWPNGLLAANQ